MASQKDLYRMTKNRYLGVDGCKAGWFFVVIGPENEAEFGVFESIDPLFQAYSDAKYILIDIPIGLPSEAKKIRTCDTEARKVLKPKRHNSVFSPPCREALSVATYLEACRINQEVLDRKISIMAYHISKKIQEVDDLLSRLPDARKIIRETHPEICFWALTGSKPMDHYKKTPEGMKERLGLLKKSIFQEQVQSIRLHWIDIYEKRLGETISSMHWLSL
jgi:predicted RNase H-like nuclease